MWIVGDSGRRLDAFNLDMDDADTAADPLGFSSPMWRFSVAEGTWHRHQISTQAGGGAGRWPSPRESASIASGGLMYGGVATRGTEPAFECLREPGWGIDDIQFRLRKDGKDQEDSQHRQLVSESDPVFLSGLWRWQDVTSHEAGVFFYQ